jgi:SH3-like domain-containing protein
MNKGGLLKALATALVVALPVLAIVPAAQAQKAKKTPYWASIAASEAMMRSGPGRNYPASWQYRRADLPIKVIEVYPNWRKVRDPDGTTGWMLVNLLSDTRTALVTGKEQRPVRENPDVTSKVRYLAEPGVVGRLTDCANDWCRIDLEGRRGYISTAHIWGVDKGESF